MIRREGIGSRSCSRGALFIAGATAAMISLALGADAPAPAGPLLPGQPRPRLGFFSASREPQARAEAALLRTPTPERERAWLRALTEEPHVAGTPEDRKTAEYVRDRLQEFGLKAEIVSYEVLLNYPKSVSLRLIAPEAAELSLREEGYARDK